MKQQRVVVLLNRSVEHLTMVCTPWVTQEQGFLTNDDLAHWRDSLGEHDGAVTVTTEAGDIYVIPARNIDYAIVETLDSESEDD